MMLYLKGIELGGTAICKLVSERGREGFELNVWERFLTRQAQN